MPRYLDVIERIAQNDPRLQWKKLQMTRTRALNQYDMIWEVRMSRRHRLFTTKPKMPLQILGFASRGDKTMFKSE